MTERRCNANQCDWRSDAEDEAAGVSADAQLAIHAIESGHTLCGTCYRSLADHERQTCERCITAAQTNLSGIRTLYDELPRHLRTVGSTVHSSGHGGSDGRPLPGGDALALLGPGSEGLDEDSKTTKEGDPVSVAFELFWWERSWRTARSEEDEDRRPRSTSSIVRRAAGYLERHTRWAATSHVGFDEYARDLRALHARLEVATARVRQPTRLNADCFACGDRLVRKIGDDGMEQPDAVCRGCGTTYTAEQLVLSMKQKLDDAAEFTDTNGDVWAALPRLAAQLDRSENTVKQWRRDGLVRVVTVQHVLYFNVADAEAENETRPKRNRAS